MKRRKCMTLLLSAALVLGMLPGNGLMSAAAAETEGEAPAAEEDEICQITIAMPVNGPVNENNEMVDYLNTLVPGLEVKLEPIEIGSYFDVLNPRLASGEIPDIIHVHNRDMYNSYLDQGILGGVPVEKIKEYMPDYVKALEEQDAVDGWSLVLKDGLIYGMPVVTGLSTYGFTNGWRKDWLDAVGIDKVPETVEEYEEAFTRFTFDDPDGNGVDDTYGFTLRGKDSVPNLFPSLFGAYGVFPGHWNVSEDGTLKYGITDPRAKAALEKLHSWYEKGLIDPEFISVDGNGRSEKFVNGQVGMLPDSTFYNLMAGDSIYEGLMSLNPNAEIVPGYAPKGEDGTYGYMHWGRLQNVVAFGKTLLEDENRLQKALQLYNLITTDVDIYNRVHFGVEGRDWEYNEDHAPVRNAAASDPANNGASGLNAFWQAGIPTTPDLKDSEYGTVLEELTMYSRAGTLVDGEDYVTYLGKFISSDVNTAYKAEAETIYNVNFIDFITGARSLDEYDQFIEEWNAAGGEAYTQAYNECYKDVEAIIAEAKSYFEE